VGQGSVFEQQAKAVPGIEVKSYPAAPENLQDLAFGRIDAALNDSLMVAYLLKQTRSCRSRPARASARSSAWASLPEGQSAVQGRARQGAGRAAADGSLKNASVKWFGTDVSRRPLKIAMELFDLLREAAPVMLRGAGYTLLFAVASMVGGLALGFPVAVMRMSRLGHACAGRPRCMSA
jgi:hypothetical protein